MRLLGVSLPSLTKLKDVVLVLGFGWAVYTFIWKEHLSREFLPPRLQISTSAQMVRRGDPYHLVKLSFKAVNTGERSVNLLSDLWFVYQIDHTIPSPATNDQSFDQSIRSFLQNGADDDKIERASTTRYGPVLAVGSLGWHSLQPGESQTLSTLVTLPSSSRDIDLAIRTPYSKVLNRNSDLWIDWQYAGFHKPIQAKVCIPADKPSAHEKWQCFLEGSGEYRRIIDQNGIRFAHEEQAFAI